MEKQYSVRDRVYGREREGKSPANLNESFTIMTFVIALLMGRSGGALCLLRTTDFRLYHLVFRKTMLGLLMAASVAGVDKLPPAIRTFMHVFPSVRVHVP
jgi:hypothetical protein